MKNKENCPNCLGEGSVDQFIADDFINQLNVIGVYGLD